MSTRGTAPAVGFEDAMLSGLASDGGLYVPQNWPRIPDTKLKDFAGKSYEDVAADVIAEFTGGEVPDQVLRAMVANAYRSFTHPAIAPLKQLDSNHWLVELFHGPTLAFKDIALQLLGRLMEWSLERRGQRATVICATSGDTGGAAVAALRGSRLASIFVLYPNGKVSDVQRRQMTACSAANVHNIAIEGNFDDCQAIVKGMFADVNFRQQAQLAAVNSINWARIVAQIVYYVTSAVALGAPSRSVSFTVPTGNFGNIFAGYAAMMMGLPIRKLIIATNMNDILDRVLRTGRYEVRAVSATSSPSMDIQVSSNFERLLFEAVGRDSSSVVRLMNGLRQSHSFTVADDALAAMRQWFLSGSADEKATLKTIRETRARTGELLDPHTAVAYSVARRTDDGACPMITLATAHPAKFPDVVAEATQARPALPGELAAIMEREEVFSVLPNDLASVMNFIRSRT